MHCRMCSPSVLEEKFSKNEHDEVPVLLPGSNKDHEEENKGLLKLTTDLTSSDDVFVVNDKADTSSFPEQDEPTEEISVVATESPLL
jgi:hypothetical protein